MASASFESVPSQSSSLERANEVVRLPRIAAVIGVRDEVELIESCVRHLRSIGVDSIVVVDCGSEDGTEDILDRLALAGTIQLLRIDADPMRDQDYFERGVRKARAVFDVDWILIQDADEFWLHASGDLRNLVLSATQAALKVSRFNACPSEQLLKWSDHRDVAIDELDLFVQPLRLSAEIMAHNPSVPWVSAQPVEKVIARAEVIGRVALGGHYVTAPDGTPIEAMAANDALIVHVPFSTFTRFQRKVINIKRLVDRHPELLSGGTGWHWRRWLEIFVAGQLEREFERQFFDANSLDSMRQMHAVHRATGMFNAA